MVDHVFGLNTCSSLSLINGSDLSLKLQLSTLGEMPWLLSLASTFALSYIETHYGPFAYGGVTPFRVVGLFFVAVPLPLMINHAHGSTAMTDGDFLFRMLLRELDIYVYFGPWLLRDALRVVWPLRRSVAAILAASIGAVVLAPNSISGSLKSRAWRVFRDWACSWSAPIQSIRGNFWRVLHLWRSAAYHKQVRCIRKAEEQQPKEAYRYQPLESNRHIRLLLLHKRRSWSALRCELLHYDLDQAPPYEALSYTWGNKPPDMPLQVGDSRLLVTSRVQEFLIYCHSSSREKLFWIDAICIHQSDTREKASQIPLMTEIYWRAERVVIWLAPPDTWKHASYIRQSVFDHLIERKYTAIPLSPKIHTLLDAPKDDFAYEVAVFLTHPWFSRSWIIQELVVARAAHILYKGVCFSWEEMGSVHRVSMNNMSARLSLAKAFGPRVFGSGHLSRYHVFIARLLEAARNVAALAGARTKFQKGVRFDFSAAVQMSHTFRCSDPRDKVLAIYGLLERTTAMAIPVSYQTPIEQVCLDAATWILGMDEWFELLYLATPYWERRQRQQIKLPSWVWDLRVEPDPDQHHHLPFMRPARKSRRDMAGRAIPDGNELKIQAVEEAVVESFRPAGDYSELVASISSLLGLEGPQSPGDADQESLAEGLRSMSQYYHSTKQMAIGRLGAGAEQAFWESWMSGLADPPNEWPAGAPHPRSAQARQMLEWWWIVTEFPERAAECADVPHSLHTLGYEKGMTAIFVLLREFINVSAAEKLCTTSTSTLALVPLHAEVGDVIAHVRGGYTLVLLRKTHADRNRAEILGFCTVHGVDDVYSGGDWQDWVLV